MAMSLTSKVHPYKAGFGPYAPEVYRVPFPDEYHWRGDDAAEDALDALRLAFRTHGRSLAGRLRRDRAGPGRGRVHPRAARLPAWAARALRRARDRARRRRGADGIRAHGDVLRDRAVRRRARPHLRREVDRRRASAVGRPRSRRDHGRARATRRSAARTSATRSPAQAALAVLDEIERLRSLRSRARDRRDDATATRRPAGPRAADRRHARPRRHARRSSSCATPPRESRTRALASRTVDLALQRGLILLKAGLHGNVIRNLGAADADGRPARRGARCAGGRDRRGQRSGDSGVTLSLAAAGSSEGSSRFK